MGILVASTMKLFGDVSVIRGSVAWPRPWRLRLMPQTRTIAPPPVVEQPAPLAPEYDEDGRLYVFRYARVSPQHYQIERDRIFEYMKQRRLPTWIQRQIRRDYRNRADFFADVREIQTPPDVEAAE
jgi:hypothetical protein